MLRTLQWIIILILLINGFVYRKNVSCMSCMSCMLWNFNFRNSYSGIEIISQSKINLLEFNVCLRISQTGDNESMKGQMGSQVTITWRNFRGNLTVKNYCHNEMCCWQRNNSMEWNRLTKEFLNLNQIKETTINSTQFRIQRNEQQKQSSLNCNTIIWRVKVIYRNVEKLVANVVHE